MVARKPVRHFMMSHNNAGFNFKGLENMMIIFLKVLLHSLVFGAMVGK